MYLLVSVKYRYDSHTSSKKEPVHGYLEEYE